jgi:enoyl-CoA hydratase
MATLVSYSLQDSIAHIAMDDGKANVLSPNMLFELNTAFDRAENDDVVVVLSGRSGLFSGGFDLNVMRADAGQASSMMNEGFSLAERILGFRSPVVVACTGHAVAMGAFLALSGDFRIGIDGPYRIIANEAAIGMTLPHGIVEICRQRLTPSHLSRVLALAEPFSSHAAVAAGFFDTVVAENDLLSAAHEKALELHQLHRASYFQTKMRIRSNALAAIRAGFDLDAVERRDLLGA